MKKILLLLAVLGAMSFCLVSCKSTNGLSKAEDLRKEYYDYDFYGFKEYLTEAELEEDLDAIEKLLPDTYVLYEDNEAAGFNLKETIAQIRKECNKIKTKENLYNSNEAAEIIGNTFKKNLKVNDEHFCIQKRDINYYLLQDAYTVYFANIYIQKTDNEYVVYSSQEEQITPGMKYTGKPENLYPCVKDNLELLRFGILNQTDLTETEFSADNNLYKVALITPEKIMMPLSTNYIIEEDDFTYFGISDWIFTTTPFEEEKEAAQKRLDALCEAAERASSKKAIIVDLRGNPGGHTTMPEKFFYALYFNNDQQRIWQYRDYTDGIAQKGTVQIASPNTERAFLRDQMPVKIDEELDPYGFDRCYIGKDEEVYSYLPEFAGQKDFSGKIYVLTNKLTASAAEYFLSLTKTFNSENTVVIGQNTLGCISVAAIKSYFLPNSGIDFNMASTDYRNIPIFKCNEKWNGELLGFYPDYWATEAEIIPTLENVTGLENLEERIYGKLMTAAYTGK